MEQIRDEKCLRICTHLVIALSNFVLVTINFGVGSLSFLERGCDGSCDFHGLFLVKLEGILSGLCQESENLHQTTQKASDGLNDR